VGYDSESQKLILASKSSLNGPFAQRFSDRFYSQVRNKDSSVERYLTKFNVSLVFEVIEPEFDPHIIEYPEPQLVLLDIVLRTPEFKRFSYETIRHQASLWGVGFKEKTALIESPEDFRSWLSAQEKTWDPSIEGYVIESADGQMVKVKLPYYVFWKQMRGLAARVIKGSAVTPPESELGQHFFEYLKTAPKELLESANIIQLRKAFENQVFHTSASIKPHLKSLTM
jgi:tRNA splicing ligase